MSNFNLPVSYDVLTPHQRRLIREEYVKEQQGECYWCGEDLDAEPPVDITELNINWDRFPPNF